MSSPTPDEYAYQKRMIDFALEVMFTKNLKGAGFLADPGLGKTRCALTVADTLLTIGEARRVLVIGPSRPLEMTWPEELVKWGLDRWKMVRLDPIVPRMMAENAQIEMISRDSLHKAIPFAGRWDFIINDEAHGFKTWGTDRMKNMRKILPYTPKRLIMTGTPTPNTLADLYSQSFICDDGLALGKNVSVFRKNFMYKGGYQGREWKLRDDKRDLILPLVAPFMIRMDAESNLDMPDLFINNVWSELPEEAERIHKQMKRELAASLATGDEVFAPNAAAAYNKLRQISNGGIYHGLGTEKRAEIIHTAKLQALVDIIDELQGKQMLVFYQFKFDADLIASAFTGVKKIDGSLKAKDAKRIIDRWLAGEFQLLIMQNQTGAEGLNLQTGGCADVGFFGLPDITNLYDQGYRRLYRHGGARSIRVHRFLTRRTVEEAQSQKVDGKIEDQATFLRKLKEFADG